VCFNDGEYELDVWFNPGNPRNVEYIEDIKKTLNSYYLKSGNSSDVAKASRIICDNFDKMTEPGTAEAIFRYDTSEKFDTFVAVINEMGRIMEQWGKEREAVMSEAEKEATPFLVDDILN
jgi:hypothetical protein